MRALVLAALFACYSPRTVPPCAVACTQESECPSGLTCIDQVCRRADQPICGDGLAPDGPVVPIECAGETGPLGRICVDPMTTITTPTTSTTIDTDSSTLCATSTAPGCVVVVAVIPPEIVVRATGTRPLIVWSPTSLTISGTIDAASHFGNAGPAADPAGCPPVNGAAANTRGAGGAGGSFGSSGGFGGAAPMVSATNPITTTAEPPFHGGCFGGTGGLCNAKNGGPGGGAVYLVASAAVTVAGKINASGGGAGPPNGASCGGGGAGSGGWVAFDAPTILFETDSVVIALGGGGGAGHNSVGQGGAAGDDPALTPTAAATSTPATGACVDHSNGGGGALGNGGGAGDGSNSTLDQCPGGGGGGGDGRVTTSPGISVNKGTVLPAPREFP